MYVCWQVVFANTYVCACVNYRNYQISPFTARRVIENAEEFIFGRLHTTGIPQSCLIYDHFGITTGGVSGTSNREIIVGTDFTAAVIL